jgi:hypothetical protein
MPEGRNLWTLQGLRAVLEVAPALQISHQLDALELAIEQGSAMAFDLADGLVGSICKTILADRNSPCDTAASTVRLFRDALAVMQLCPSGHPDPARARADLEETIRGLTGAVQGLYNLRRNHGVIAHGRDAYDIRLEAAQIMLAARAADAIATFLLTVHRDYARVQPMHRLRYEDNPDFNDWIDATHLVVICDVELSPSEVLFTVDHQAYRNALLNFEPEEEAEEQVEAEQGVGTRQDVNVETEFTTLET